jgi:NCS1 family nucleobase:cation symporter-1
MGPLAGVMVCDYYIIKQRKLDVNELYKDHGIYHYSHGFNWRAFLAFFIGLGPLLPGFAKSIDNSLDVGGSWKVYTFAWLYGFFTASLSYYVICKYISGLGVAIIDVAVLPPQITDGVADIESGDSELFAEKGTEDVGVKEVKGSF